MRNRRFIKELLLNRCVGSDELKKKKNLLVETLNHFIKACASVWIM